MTIGCLFCGTILRNLPDLANERSGDTVWVLGSGPSLNFMGADFFADKIVVSTNFSADIIGVNPQYMFSHYHQNTFDLHTLSGTVVTLERDTVSHDEWRWDLLDNLVLVPQDSYEAPGASWDPFTRNPPRDDSLAYGSSSLHGAMHLAAHVGAAHIVLVGADCGTIDGEHRVENYPGGKHTPWELYNRHHKLMKDWLVGKYGVTVHSLNPFINLNLEGHNFQGV